MRRLTALMLPLVLGCSLTTPKDPEHVALKIAQSHAFSEFTLTFIDVENDSRCPAQMMCVWAGNVQVAVTAVDHSLRIAILAAKQFLNTNSEPRSLKVAGVTLALDSVTPPRITADSIPQANYTAYFTVTRP